MSRVSASFPVLGLLLAAALAACGGETVDVGEEANNTAANNNTANNNTANNNTTGNNTTGNNTTGNNTTGNNTGGNNGTCADVTLYPDGDGDGFGGDGATMTQCLTRDQTVSGYSRSGGDCDDAAAWINPGIDDVCGDAQDENCTAADDSCPTTQTAALDTPSWSCMGAPPANVLAWATFADGDGYYQDNGCFMIFEGIRGEFYVKRDLTRVNTDAGCDTINGCVCPSLNGWPSYDRRLYAFTLQGTPESCAPISIRDHGGEDQPVSNACRKYLYQMHWPGQEIPLPFFATGEASARRRIADYPTVEVACAEDAPHANLPFQSLLTASFQLNPGFTPKP